jgi:predicted aspartyl protease
MNTKSVKTLFGLSLAMFLTLTSSSLHAEWIPFRIEQGSIIIDIELAGQPATVMLDSGATINMIDQEFVDKYGQDFSKLQKVETEGVNETTELWLYGGIPVKMFGSELKMSNVGAVDLGPADLLLGGGFFKQSIIQIDYPQSRLQILGKKAVDMNKHSNVPMKSARGSRAPAIEVELNGNKAWLIVDTGTSAGIYLQRDFAKDKGLLKDDTQVVSKTIKGINSEARADSFLVNSIKIGPYEMDNIAVDVPAEGQRTNLNPNSFETKIGTRIKRTVKTKGRIGYDMLKHFVVTLDYSGFKVNLYAP